MAKRKTEEVTDLAVVPEGLAGLVLQDTSLAARPDYLTEGDTRGLDTISKEDMLMPRLAIAQQMSPQLSDADPSYIEDLRQGDFFNTITKQVYGKGPLYFSVVQTARPIGIEFMPREQGGGVLDFNVPLNDPRMQFTIDTKTGKSVPPVATLFYNYVIMLFLSDGTREMLGLALKSSGIKTARTLNTLMKQRSAMAKGAPCFAGLYSVLPVRTKAPKGEYFAYVIDNAGWVTKEVFQYLEPIFEGLKDKEVKIDTGDDAFAERDSDM